MLKIFAIFIIKFFLFIFSSLVSFSKKLPEFFDAYYPKFLKKIIRKFTAMPKENNKIVIIVGAGASADFVATQEKKLNENQGDIKFEI